MKRHLALALLLISAAAFTSAQVKASAWRAATESELKALIPPRALVEKEHIETELRTASGITDGRGRFIAGVVLITAGYSAEGKYSHFFIVQSPLKIGDFKLGAGQYVFGWTHNSEDSLLVKFYEASSGKLLGQVEAARNPAVTRVESFRILPPSERSLIQIGRFTFPYQLTD